MSADAVKPADKPDNLFGICARLGEDFGFNPLYLRVLFGMTLIFAPVVVLSTYFGLGALVLISRLVFPKQKHMAASQPVAVIEPAAPEYELPLAA